ncbi:MAG: VOC family protein [Chloroflexota bacterium]|nr:VOC family protein [Chloroflexota bacterium]
MRLTHVRLLVRDYTAAFRFWRDTVGLMPTFGDERGPYADFDTGPATLALFTATAMSNDTGIDSARGGRGADDVVVVLGVDGVDESARRLEERGVRFVTQPTDQPGWGIRVAHFRDPDGNLIELYSALAPAQREPA